MGYPNDASCAWIFNLNLGAVSVYSCANAH